MKNFATPHCHIQSLDSASTPAAFADRELELGTGVITCTDHGTMGACSDVYDLAKAKGLTPILGVEAYLRDDDCQILSESGIEKDERGTYAKYNKYYHLLLHARNGEAYEALTKTISDADLRAEQHGSERKPLLTWAQLENLGCYDITMSSGCLIGVVQRHLQSDRPDIAIKYYEKLRSIPKAGNFLVEVFPHRCTHYWVSGVFMTLEGGEKLKFWKGKKVKVSSISNEVTVEQVARLVSRGADVGNLIAVKNSRSWEDRDPRRIVECKVVEDFMANECTEMSPDGDIQCGANKFVISLAQRYGDKILISDDSHFARPEEKIVQDSRLMSSGGTWKFHNSYHRFDSQEAFGYFKQYLGIDSKTYESWVDNNNEWAASFKDFAFKERRSLPTRFYPTNTLEHLKNLIDKHGRMDWRSEVKINRLQSEIQLLHQNGTIDLLPYFFLAEEVVDLYARNHMLTGPGRGSAAGLLVTYLLGITHINPIKYALSQDRFLTVDRIKSGKLPDIDQDLPQRDLLLDPQNGWLYNRFGNHVAAISTNTMLRLKSSIKDVARAVHGQVDDYIETLCKKLPNPPQGIDDHDFVFGYTADDGKEVKGLFEESKELQAYAANRPDEWKTVQKFLGIARGKSRHACAFVIANEPIDNFLPLTTISGIRTTQYTATGVEARGGLKMDFLSLNSLSDIGNCIQLIQHRNGGIISEPKIIDGIKVLEHQIVPMGSKVLNIWDLPEDQTVYNDIVSGDTETVFQLNTKSARQWMREFNYWRDSTKSRKAIDSIDAIAAFTALDRPGPLDAFVEGPEGRHNMLVEYARRARGEKPTDPIEALNILLPETYGVMTYQEGLQHVYQQLTGCDGLEANEFRTNVAKKKMEKVLKAYKPFIERASQKIGVEQAEKVWQQMVTFGQYGFCKAHAYSYATIAYACAYLKHYFPLEWWTAVLRNADKNEIAEKFWPYCKQLVDMPDIRYSGDVFEIQNGRIRAPLSFLHGIGPKAHEELARGRPYAGIEDFCQKIAEVKAVKVIGSNGKPRAATSALNSGVVTRLIVSGVADSLFKPETMLIEKIDAYEQALAKAMKKKTPGKKQEANRELYLNMTPLIQYQLQKTILPIYSRDLLPYLIDIGYPGIVVAKDRPQSFCRCYSPTGDALEDLIVQWGNREALNGERSALQQPLPIVTGKQLKWCNEDQTFPEGKTMTVAVVGYVLNERRFTYHSGTAVELTIDVDGEQFVFVKWPSKRTGKLNCPNDISGSVAIMTLSRYKVERPFSLNSVNVIQQPLTDSKNVEESKD